METELKKILNFTDIFLVGIGYIVGAGIYALLYITTKKAKNFTWLSFLIGGLISLLTGLSYAKLSQRINTNATEYDYFTKIISKNFKVFPAILLLLSGCFICSTLLISFSNILSNQFTNKKYKLSIIILILGVCSGINILNLKLTKNLNNVIAVLESSLLIIVILFSLKYWKLPSFDTKLNFKNIFDGAFLTLFTYSGFNSIPKLSEETIDSEKNIPLGIITSIIFTIVLYSLTSIGANSILGSEEVSNWVNPISKIYGKLFGSKFEKIIDISTLFSIFNTILLSILFVSRQFYGISKDFKYLKKFTKVNKKTDTPINSIIFVSIITLVLCVYKNIEFNNYISNLFLFFIYIIVNSSLIILYKKEKEKDFTKYIYPIFGVISSIFVFINSL